MYLKNYSDRANKDFAKTVKNLENYRKSISVLIISNSNTTANQDSRQ